MLLPILRFYGSQQISFHFLRYSFLGKLCDLNKEKISPFQTTTKKYEMKYFVIVGLKKDDEQEMVFNVL
jgi:hypothetical protein